jgi:hypothetical protein
VRSSIHYNHFPYPILYTGKHRVDVRLGVNLPSTLAGRRKLGELLAALCAANNSPIPIAPELIYTRKHPDIGKLCRFWAGKARLKPPYSLHHSGNSLTAIPSRPARDLIFVSFVHRSGKNDVGLIGFDHLPGALLIDLHHGGVIRDTRGLIQIMGNDDDGKFCLSSCISSSIFPLINEPGRDWEWSVVNFPPGASEDPSNHPHARRT